jgi:hypothetical protein
VLTFSLVIHPMRIVSKIATLSWEASRSIIVTIALFGYMGSISWRVSIHTLRVLISTD